MGYRKSNFVACGIVGLSIVAAGVEAALLYLTKRRV